MEQNFFKKEIVLVLTTKYDWYESHIVKAEIFNIDMSFGSMSYKLKFKDDNGAVNFCINSENNTEYFAKKNILKLKEKNIKHIDKIIENFNKKLNKKEKAIFKKKIEHRKKMTEYKNEKINLFEKFKMQYGDYYINYIKEVYKDNPKYNNKGDCMIPVLITTDKDKRGVFFGYINAEDVSKDELRAEQVQMCVYWSRDVGGVLGLAAGGPTKTCRVSAPAPAGYIKGITLIVEASEEAVAAWKLQPWGA